MPFLNKAQQQFVPGYIVTEKSDTLKGDIKLNSKKEQDLYNKIIFKDTQGIQKTYKPNKVKAYGFDKTHFETKEFGGEKFFFKVIAQGEISMYKLIVEEVRMNASSFSPEYFLIREGDKKMTDVKPAKLKKQLQEMMSGAASYASDYEGDKNIDEVSAANVITKYNNRPK
ncbi:MAG: hypothetical protein JSU07_08100 [Bacteroidetes bacterium]|nr:hypothetical protein [Bacteroidota bacterium]